jgi:hypothetical protein
MMSSEMGFILKRKFLGTESNTPAFDAKVKIMVRRSFRMKSSEMAFILKRKVLCSEANTLSYNAKV